MANSSAGPGLGLTIVRSIVEHHHGSLSVSSTEGEGTTVEVRLRRRASAGPDAAVLEPAGAGVASGERVPVGEHVGPRALL